MKLYHGSTVDITEIDLAKSKPNKDFCKAFYLSGHILSMTIAQSQMVGHFMTTILCMVR